MGEPFRLVARFNVVDTCFDLEDTLDEAYDLVEIPLEGFVMCLGMRSLLALVLMILFSLTLLIIPMLPLFAHYPLNPRVLS